MNSITSKPSTYGVYFVVLNLGLALIFIGSAMVTHKWNFPSAAHVGFFCLLVSLWHALKLKTIVIEGDVILIDYFLLRKTVRLGKTEISEVSFSDDGKPVILVALNSPLRRVKISARYSDQFEQLQDYFRSRFSAQ